MAPVSLSVNVNGSIAPHACVQRMARVLRIFFSVSIFAFWSQEMKTDDLYSRHRKIIFGPDVARPYLFSAVFYLTSFGGCGSIGIYVWV